MSTKTVLRTIDDEASIVWSSGVGFIMRRDDERPPDDFAQIQACAVCGYLQNISIGGTSLLHISKSSLTALSGKDRSQPPSHLSWGVARPHWFCITPPFEARVPSMKIDGTLPLDVVTGASLIALKILLPATCGLLPHGVILWIPRSISNALHMPPCLQSQVFLTYANELLMLNEHVTVRNDLVHESSSTRVNINDQYRLSRTVASHGIAAALMLKGQIIPFSSFSRLPISLSGLELWLHFQYPSSRADEAGKRLAFLYNPGYRRQTRCISRIMSYVFAHGAAGHVDFICKHFWDIRNSRLQLAIRGRTMRHMRHTDPNSIQQSDISHRKLVGSPRPTAGQNKKNFIAGAQSLTTHRRKSRYRESSS